MSIKKIKKTDPMKTKTGKERLGPLNLAQLNKLLENAQRPKIKAKISREIARKEKNKEKQHGIHI